MMIPAGEDGCLRSADSIRTRGDGVSGNIVGEEENLKG